MTPAALTPAALTSLPAQVDRLLIDAVVGDDGRAAYQVWAEVRSSGAARLTVDVAGAELIAARRGGTPTLPVALPFSGIAETVTVEPRQGAALDRGDGGLVLYAPRPGSYAVTVRGRQALEGDGGVHRLRLAASPAPVASAELDLPADREWSAGGAVVVGEELRGGRRLVRLAPARGAEHVVEMRRRLAGREEDRVLARSTVVSVVEVRGRNEHGLQRQDVVLYEVLRGELGTFELDLPPGLEVDWTATDEGDAVPLVSGGRLTVERKKRLTGTGHLVIAYRPQPIGGAPVPWPPVDPLTGTVQARYLMAASAVAAELEPLPAASWQRVDLEDLPDRLRAELAALTPNAVWRLADDGAETRLAATPLPPADRVGGVVWERSTTTFLTVDGTLVHRDRFVVEMAGTSLAVGLPEGARLWSAQVDALAVRPLERGDDLVVPLAFKSEGRTVVEVVAVEERAIERGRSTLRLEAPRVAEPVVRHEWRLLLPEDNRYRFAAGELRPVVDPLTVESYVRLGGLRPRSVAAPPPIPGLSGIVADTETVGLPGAIVTVRGTVDRVAVTDAQGHFRFPSLPGGTYTLVASLDGFSTVEYPNVAVQDGRSTQLEIVLSTAVEETITITSESPLLDARDIERRRREAEGRQVQAAAAVELDALRSGLQGGVKPLAVEIPESGKLLLLSGALPPPRVGVELDVRAR
jgi:hypothetical protein